MKSIVYTKARYTYALGLSPKTLLKININKSARKAYMATCTVKANRAGARYAREFIIDRYRICMCSISSHFP